MYCRSFSRVTVLYPLDVSTLPGRDNQKHPQALPDVPKKINVLIEDRTGNGFSKGVMGESPRASQVAGWTPNQE